MRQIARDRDKARLSLEKAERHCLQLGRELDEQYTALEHTQSKLRYEGFFWGDGENVLTHPGAPFESPACCTNVSVAGKSLESPLHPLWSQHPSNPALISCSVHGGVCTLWPARNMLCLSQPCCFFSPPRDFQAEMEAKELLLQQAVSHQAKLEADTRLLQGKEANLQGRLNRVMNVSKTALDETSLLSQRWQSRGGDKYRWFTLLLLGRAGILCRSIVSHIHTVVLNKGIVTLLWHY